MVSYKPSMDFKFRVFTAVATLALLTTAVSASAEIVFLKSGRTLSVRSHRIDGERITLTLRGGGEVTCDKTVVDKIEADEVPYIEPPVAKTEKPDETPVAAPVQQDRPLMDGTPYAEIIASAAEAHGVDPMLVRALIQVESGYRPRARSRKGAMGLMQLMPSTAREYNVRHPFEPKANIEAGIKHLKTLIDRFGDDVGLALAAYNAGPGAVEKFNGIPPYRETRSYVSRILALAGLK
jgi:transglycosylase-like protein with SLT domain